MKSWIHRAIGMALAVVCVTAAADINIGVTISETGPGAALGVPQRRTIELAPQTIAGQKIHWEVLDDATDPTNASKNAAKLLSEQKVDVLVGSSITANTAAIVDAAVESGTPLMALAPLELPPAKDKWVFKMPQNNALMAQALVEHMVATHVKSLGIIAFADVYGDQWVQAITPQLERAGIKLVASERFARTDTSVAGQVIKIIVAHPDAVLVVGGGTPAALPHITLTERGFKGTIYQTHGAPSAAFLQLGGKNVEGGIFVSGPLLAREQLPDSAPTKAAVSDYLRRYESKFGPGSVVASGGHMWDAWILLERAIPQALKKAQPGTPAFRSALRDALEASHNVPGVHGVYSMSATDHFGHDQNARVLLRVENGAFKLISSSGTAR